MLVLIARWADDARIWNDAKIVDVPRSSATKVAFNEYPKNPGERLGLWELGEAGPGGEGRPSTFIVGMDSANLWNVG